MASGLVEVHSQTKNVYLHDWSTDDGGLRVYVHAVAISSLSCVFVE